MMDQLTNTIVRILNDNEEINGLGFFVSEQHLLTCVHVVTRALNLKPDTLETPTGDIYLDIPSVERGRIFTARVVHWRPSNSDDLAVLKLEIPPTTAIRPARLVATEDMWEHHFRAFGFPSGYDNGLWTDGRLLGKESDGLIQLEVEKASVYPLGRGFSGTPVWDTQVEGIVGMVVTADTQPRVKAAFMIPVSKLVIVWPELEHYVFQERRASSEKLDTPSNKRTSMSAAIARVASTAPATPKNFFISYNNDDRAWAQWIAWQLEDAKYSVVIQAWDFRPGSNFVLEMQKAAQEAERTIAVLSPSYFSSHYTQSEWASAFAQDPTGEDGTLLPVRVQECELPKLWKPIVYIDLVGLNERVASERLLEGVRRGRVKPITAPNFPAQTPHTIAKQPRFPGGATLQGKPNRVYNFPLFQIFRHQEPRLTKALLYALVGLIIISVFIVARPLWYSMLFPSMARPLSIDDQGSNVSNALEIPFSAIQSKFWVIAGNPMQYSLNNLPEKQIGVLHTDGHTSAPLYYLYFNLRDSSKEDFKLIIEEVDIVIQQVRPMPHPVPIWEESSLATYESPHKFEALYTGQESGAISADYVKSDYLTHNSGFVFLSPGETDTIEVHMVSRLEADVVFSVQVIYRFSNGSQRYMLRLPRLFEVAFVSPSDWRLYHLQDGHFVLGS